VTIKSVVQNEALKVPGSRLRSQILMAVSITVAVFLGCGAVTFCLKFQDRGNYPVDGGSRFIRNVDDYLPKYIPQKTIIRNKR
jgi:hypothetical protein